MATADLTAARLREVLDYDPETGILTRVADVRAGKGHNRIIARKGDVAGAIKYGYVVICIDYKLYLAHRLAWLYTHGRWPEKDIDHINGVRDDNRIANLRDVSRAVNTQNRRARTTVSKSGLLGAHWYARDKNWRAVIMSDRRLHFLGSFETAEDAHQAYLAAKRRLHEGCTI